jgi:16S rRNA G966 N2-methylase RsmD
MNLRSFISHLTRHDKIVAKMNALLEKTDFITKQQQELLMTQKYHDTIANYEWLKYKGISPGGWAVDYAFCYTLARTLNAMHPQSILECGLGQSSRIIHQYAAFYHVNAITCEHDQTWIDFIKKEFGNNYPLKIWKTELEEIEFKGQKTLTYHNIQEIFKGKRFELILIDGPFGSPHYSRSQAIELCKNNLSDRFCVIIDDTERDGEKETIDEIKKVLTEKSVDFATTVYSSTKSHTLLCSKDLFFLTSL